PRAGVVISRKEVGTGGPDLADMGCFGKAEHDVPGGPEQFKSSLDEIEQRVKSDPRLIQANRDWARCMSAAGYTDFDKPDDIQPYLFGKLQALTNSSEGEIRFDPDNLDQAAL